MKNNNYPNYSMQNNNLCSCKMQNNNPSGCNRMDGMRIDGTCMNRMDSKMDCDRKQEEICVNKKDFPVGMAYVPWTRFTGIYDPEKSLNVGTIFEDLDKPFYGRRAFFR